MKCKVCGSELPADASFCGICGNRIEPVHIDSGITCKRCGAKNNNGVQYCGTCGAHLAENRSREYTPRTYAPKKKSSVPLIIALCIVCLVCAVLIGVIAYVICSEKSPYKPVDYTIQDNSVQATGSIATAPPAVQTASPMPTSGPAVDLNGEYLFPTDTTYITDSDLQGKTQGEVRLILNEMYARHGYIFQTEYYSQYFGRKSWYIPRSGSQADCERQFNSIERANKEFISSYESARGWR